MTSLLAAGLLLFVGILIYTVGMYELGRMARLERWDDTKSFHPMAVLGCLTLGLAMMLIGYAVKP